MKYEYYDIVIIGGGFFGMCVAEYFAKCNKRVLICEKESECMTHASYVNQARVHNGYHYPRSILTASRSHESFPKFVNEFDECIYKEFNKYYGVAKILGKVNAIQYKNFCKQVGDFCEVAPDKIKALFNPQLIEEIFITHEYAFDANILRKMMLDRLSAVNVEISYNTEVVNIKNISDYNNVIDVKCLDDNIYSVNLQHVFNCTYANINLINHNSEFDIIPLKHEMTEMALLDVPDEIKGNGFTIMCGPFFSIMPFPAENTYSLSHVRYTPHYEWYDNSDKYISPLIVAKHDRHETAYSEMIHDASRYMPVISECEYKKSIWDIKTVLPSSEIDDSRPILFKLNYQIKGYHCIMGGKIDNIYDVFEIFNMHKEDIFK